MYDWIVESETTDINKLSKATLTIAHLKIALQRVYFHLWNEHTFDESIQQTISEGGDTDTNACIVGGIMGLYYGLSNINQNYIDKIKQCVPKQDKYNRAYYQARNYFEQNLVTKLLNCSCNDNTKIIRYDV